jgi:uncharacterized protein
MTGRRISIDADGPELAFWQGVERGALLLQRCTACTCTWHPPAWRCPGCGAGEHEWIEASGAGTIYSFTIVHHAPHAAFMDRVPYTLALVDLVEGPRMATRLVEGFEPAVGMTVAVQFDRTDGLALPVFAPARDD